MIYILTALLAISSLLFLIVIHEFGHAITAQKLGIPIKRFAIGFGKVIWSKTSSKSNIEYALCMIPVGGYIQFQDQNIYESAPIYKRFLIVLAGPVCNLIVAFIAYWSVFMMGVTSITPIIEKTIPNTPAFQYSIPSQSKIIAIDHFSVQTWPAIMIRLLPHLGNRNDAIVLTIQPLHTIQTMSFSITTDKWSLTPVKPNLLESLGIIPDKNAPLITHHYSFLQSIIQSLREIQIYLKLNCIILAKLITGKIPISSLAGPLSLFSSTISAAHQGTVTFFAFIGFISIGLFFANLLPIPGLDGAYIVYFLIEAIRGKPLSIRSQLLLFRLGVIFICVIMFQTLMNDLLRLF